MDAPHGLDRVVGVTGMVVQRVRRREILAELKRWRAFTIADGPWVGVSEGISVDSGLDERSNIVE